MKFILKNESKKSCEVFVCSELWVLEKDADSEQFSAGMIVGSEEYEHVGLDELVVKLTDRYAEGSDILTKIPDLIASQAEDAAAVDIENVSVSQSGKLIEIAFLRGRLRGIIETDLSCDRAMIIAIGDYRKDIVLIMSDHIESIYQKYETTILPDKLEVLTTEDDAKRKFILAVELFLHWQQYSASYKKIIPWLDQLSLFSTCYKHLSSEKNIDESISRQLNQAIISLMKRNMGFDAIKNYGVKDEQIAMACAQYLSDDETEDDLAERALQFCLDHKHVPWKALLQAVRKQNNVFIQKFPVKYLQSVGPIPDSIHSPDKNLLTYWANQCQRGSKLVAGHEFAKLLTGIDWQPGIKVSSRDGFIFYTKMPLEIPTGLDNYGQWQQYSYLASAAICHQKYKIHIGTIDEQVRQILNEAVAAGVIDSWKEVAPQHTLKHEMRVKSAILSGGLVEDIQLRSAHRFLNQTRVTFYLPAMHDAQKVAKLIHDIDTHICKDISPAQVRCPDTDISMPGIQNLYFRCAYIGKKYIPWSDDQESLDETVNNAQQSLVFQRIARELRVQQGSSADAPLFVASAADHDPFKAVIKIQETLSRHVKQLSKGLLDHAWEYTRRKWIGLLHDDSASKEPLAVRLTRLIQEIKPHIAACEELTKLMRSQQNADLLAEQSVVAFVKEFKHYYQGDCNTSVKILSKMTSLSGALKETQADVAKRVAAEQAAVEVKAPATKTQAVCRGNKGSKAAEVAKRVAAEQAAVEVRAAEARAAEVRAAEVKAVEVAKPVAAENAAVEAVSTQKIPHRENHGTNIVLGISGCVVGSGLISLIPLILKEVVTPMQGAEIAVPLASVLIAILLIVVIVNAVKKPVDSALSTNTVVQKSGDDAEQTPSLNHQ